MSKKERLPRTIVDEPKADVMHVRCVQTGDRYTLDKESIVLLGLDANGRLWMSRTGVDRVTVITSNLRPVDSGFILEPSTDDEDRLREVEARIIELLSLYS